jgi:hypothetical protein
MRITVDFSLKLVSPQRFAALDIPVSMFGLEDKFLTNMTSLLLVLPVTSLTSSALISVTQKTTHTTHAMLR